MEEVEGHTPWLPFVVQSPQSPEQYQFEQHVRSNVRWPNGTGRIYQAVVARALWCVLFPHFLDYEHFRARVNLYLREQFLWSVTAAQRILTLEQRVQQLEGITRRLDLATSWIPRTQSPTHAPAGSSDVDYAQIRRDINYAQIRQAQATAHRSRGGTPVWVPSLVGELFLQN